MPLREVVRRAPGRRVPPIVEAARSSRARAIARGRPGTTSPARGPARSWPSRGGWSRVQDELTDRRAALDHVERRGRRSSRPSVAVDPRRRPPAPRATRARAGRRSGAGSRCRSPAARGARRSSVADTMISVAESSAVIPIQVQATRSPKRAAAARKSAKKRKSGGPMRAPPFSPGTAELDRRRRRTQSGCSDDVVRSARRQTETDVDPRDDHRDQDSPGDGLEVARETRSQARSARGASRS